LIKRPQGTVGGASGFGERCACYDELEGSARPSIRPAHLTIAVTQKVETM
jgi:hypothetical protein